MFRLLLSGIYILLVFLFLAFLVIGAGHGRNPFEFVFFLAYPAGFLLDLLPASWVPGIGMPVLLLFMLAGLIQWAIIGYLIDKLVARRGKRKLAQDAGSLKSS